MAKIALRFDNVTKSFGTKKVHQGLTLDLYENEIVAILGGSGAGKSLLLKMVIGLERLDSGRIIFEGRDIACLSEDELAPIRSKIGFVFQDGALFDSLTIEENLAYPLRIHKNWSEEEIKTVIDERLALLNLENTNALYPNEISGGMAKRVGLARATILSPKVILFDEPTAGLDPINIRRFVHTVLDFKKKSQLTALFVTHDIAAALAISDRMAVIKDGRIYAIDGPRTICRNEDPYIKSFTDFNYADSLDISNEPTNLTVNGRDHARKTAS
jgi:phospholipid/cholesterol/gamma-HCH transport system ATP-binding protein